MLEPGGYLVIARDPEFLRALHTPHADRIVGPDTSDEALAVFGTLADRGERLRLVDHLGNVIDEVRYFDEGEWDELADRNGGSLELIDAMQDNAVPLAWRASEEAVPEWTKLEWDVDYDPIAGPGSVTPEMHVFLLSSGECLLDEISLTDAQGQEFVENGHFDENTDPWRIWGNHVDSHRTEEDTAAGAGALRLVATGGGNNKVNRVEVDLTGAPRNQIHVSLQARWLQGSNALHISGHNNVYGRTVWLPVPKSIGTPGRENSVRANLGPVITELRHEPPVPLPFEPVRFHAEVSDSDGVESVVLHFEVQGGAEVLQETALLVDDGRGADGREGDGHFSVEVAGLEARGLVRFWVEARDTLDNVSRFPRGAPETAYTLIVDGEVETPAHVYRLVLDQENEAELRSRLLHSNDLVRGTFVFEDTQVHYNVGTRYHGSPWNRPPAPRMYRVRFNSDHRFRHDAKRINVSRYGFAQNEGTAYQLLRKASVSEAPVPYSRHYNYAHTKINAEELSKRMAEIRVVDRDYVEYHWPQGFRRSPLESNRKAGVQRHGTAHWESRMDGFSGLRKRSPSGFAISGELSLLLQSQARQGSRRLRSVDFYAPRHGWQVH